MSQIKTFIIVFLLLVSCIGVGAGIRYYRLYSEAIKPHPPAPGYSGSSAISVPIINTYTDAAGSQHAVVQTPEAIVRMGRRNAEAIFNNTIKPKIDSIAAASGVKAKDIEGFTAVQLGVVRDSVRFMARVLDSQRRQTRSYRDKYLTLLVRDPLPDDTSDKGSFDFAYNADIKTADYSRKRKILGMRIGKRDYFTDLSSSDPRMRIKGVNKFTVDRRVPPLGLRVQALAGYNLQSRDYSAGMGVRLDVGERLNGGINYTYNFIRQQWVPGVYAKYDLLQFGR